MLTSQDNEKIPTRIEVSIVKINRDWYSTASTFSVICRYSLNVNLKDCLLSIKT